MPNSGGRKVVYVLGAGFSYAMGHSIHVGKTNIRMPLQDDFIEKLNLFHYRKVDKLEKISKIIRKYFSPETYRATRGKGSKRNRDIFGISIEEIVTFFDEAKRMTESEKLEFLETEDEIRSLVVEFVTKMSRGVSGGKGTILWNFRERLKKTDTVISFNWDTILETSLRRWDGWHEYFGYGRTVWNLLKNNVEFPARNIENKKHVRLLKLHGSVNWRATSAGLFIDLRKPIATDEVVMMPPKLLKSEIWEREKGTPPATVVGNEASKYLSLYPDIWNEAEEALEKAKKLVFIGYSFPPSDFAIKNMIRRAIGNTKALEEKINIQIVDPNAKELASLFEHSFKLKVPLESQFLSLENYLITAR